MQRCEFERVRWREEQRGRVRQVQGDPAVLAGEGAGAGPHQLAGRGEFVEHRGRVVRHAGRQDELLQGGRGDGGALQLLDRAHQSVDSAQPVALADVLPLGQELSERGGRHRLQLVPQRGQGAAAQAAQHGRVAPLLADAGRVELPCTTRPLAASRCNAPSVTATPRPKRAAAVADVNGPWVRACRARRSPSGSLTGSVKASGTPTGSAVPSASRRRPASSIAAQWSAPAIRTRIARRAEASSWAHCGAAPRSANSASVSGPSILSRSATPSASLMRRSSVSHCSSRPARSAPRRRAVRAAPPGRAARPAGGSPGTGRRARRSASGESPS